MKLLIVILAIACFMLVWSVWSLYGVLKEVLAKRRNERKLHDKILHGEIDVKTLKSEYLDTLCSLSNYYKTSFDVYYLVSCEMARRREESFAKLREANKQ